MPGLNESTTEHARPSHEELERKEGKSDTPLHRLDKDAMKSAKKAQNTIKRHEQQNTINPNGMGSV